jgi:hypothetical protein
MAKTKATKTIALPAPNVGRMKVRIRGLTPLMQNRWRPTVIEGMRGKQEGKAKNKREARDPDAEVAEILEAATVSKNGKVVYGHPLESIVEAMASAGHRMGEGWAKKGPAIKGAVTVMVPGSDLIPIEGPRPVRDTRPGRIKGTWTIVHRPKYERWAMEFVVEFEHSLFSQETFLHLLMLAGRTVGIGSFRVENGGQYGRFEIEGAEIEEV